jgi:rhodanese-related sulfurtransferase
MAETVTAAQLRDWLRSGAEIAIVDAREEGGFHDRHLLMASCLPLSRLELNAPGLLPRRSAPIVVCDAGALAPRGKSCFRAWAGIAVNSAEGLQWGRDRTPPICVARAPDRFHLSDFEY